MIGSYTLGIQSFGKDIPEQFRGILLVNATLFYLYFKAIVLDNRRFNWNDLLHFILPLVFVGFTSLLEYIPTQFQLFLKTFNYFGILVFLTTYYILSIRLLRNKLWKVPSSIHLEHYKLIRNWTFFLIALLTLLLLRNFASFTIDFINHVRISGHPFYVPQSIIWLIIFGKILVSPEILYGLPKLNQKINGNKTDLMIMHNFWTFNIVPIDNQNDLKLKGKIDTKITNLIEEIEFVTTKKLLFRNPKITISDVASEIGVPVSHIVYIFKYHCIITFTEFKTIMKIEDSKHLIDSGFLKTSTLESLAFKTGFSSYSPFFTAFKKITGSSPNEYSNSSQPKKHI